MSKPSIAISMIAAMDRNRVIGRGGDLPWRLSSDLRRFKEVTMGKAILMGRRTFESIGRALPGRLNLVWTSRDGLADPKVVVVRSLADAIGHVEGEPEHAELVVIGGESVYAAAMGMATMLDLSLVDTEVDGGDAWFPPFDRGEWCETSRRRIEADDRNEHPFEIVQLERIGAAST